MWVGATLQNDTLTGASQTALIRVFAAAILALRPFTLVRQHYSLSIQSDQVVATEDQQVAVGTAVVSDQAVAIGVTAVPTPLTDLGSDLWTYWQWQQASFLFGDATGFLQFATPTLESGSKAMRKLEDGQDLVMTIESSAASDGFTLTTIGRLLIKLH